MLKHIAFASIIISSFASVGFAHTVSPKTEDVCTTDWFNTASDAGDKCPGICGSVKGQWTGSWTCNPAQECIPVSKYPSQCVCNCQI